LYLQKVLTEIDVDEPCIILPPEVSMEDLKLLVDFIYRGEIRFLMNQLASLSKLAQMLGIPGLPGFTEAVKIYVFTKLFIYTLCLLLPSIFLRLYKSN